MSEPLVVVTVADGVGRLRLNRPDKRNALNTEVSRQVLEAMAQLEADADVVCIVIEGTDGAFCAGADMGEALPHYEAGDMRFNPSQDAANRVGAARKPTIAAVDGPAYGAGALLACMCDIRIASDRARFRFPGAEYGLVVGAYALPGLVGGPLAKELIFTSRVVGAEEAASIGLVNRVAPLAAFEATVAEVAGAVAASSPLALEWAKATINTAVTGGDANGMEQQADLLLRGGPDHMTRFTAATQRVVGRGAS
ncbi:MAG: enoyl-CoA hydratase/isomerase family protein [Dehalococcoidia bacterium]|nr:enoyl-CoA hydratase/isomerase family protein [Dehalococcoidia bacterium]